MALPASGIWEIDVTAGNDANGGLFDPSVASAGTDYTYGGGQTAIAYADLVIQATTTNLASVARAFVAADVGNTIKITSGTGFTVGRYNIRSVSGGIATMDRSVGTTASTGGTGTLGGACASPGEVAGHLVTGQTAYQKAGTYNIANGTVNTSGQKVSIASINWRIVGYNTTRDDITPTNGLARPVWIGVTSATYTMYASTSNAFETRNVIFDGGAPTLTNITPVTGNGSVQYFRNCMLRNSGQQYTNGSGSVWYDCQFTAFSSRVFSGPLTFYRCKFYANTGTQTIVANGTLFMLDCEMRGTSGVNASGIFQQSSANMTLINLTIQGMRGHGIDISTAPAAYIQIDNCLLYGNGYGGTGYGINVAATAYRIAMNNSAFGGNTTGAFETAKIPDASNTVTLSADPFTDAAGGDLTLNNTSGAGASCRAAGIPSYTDIGAYQHQDSGGGSGGGSSLFGCSFIRSAQ